MCRALLCVCVTCMMWAWSCADQSGCSRIKSSESSGAACSAAWSTPQSHSPRACIRRRWLATVWSTAHPCTHQLASVLKDCTICKARFAPVTSWFFNVIYSKKPSMPVQSRNSIRTTTENKQHSSSFDLPKAGCNSPPLKILPSGPSGCSRQRIQCGISTPSSCRALSGSWSLIVGAAGSWRRAATAAISGCVLRLPAVYYPPQPRLPKTHPRLHHCPQPAPKPETPATQRDNAGENDAATSAAKLVAEIVASPIFYLVAGACARFIVSGMSWIGWVVLPSLTLWEDRA